MDPIYIDSFDYIIELTEELKSFNKKNFKSIRDFNDLQLLQKELEEACESHKSFLKARNLLSNQRD